MTGDSPSREELDAKLAAVRDLATSMPLHGIVSARRVLAALGEADRLEGPVALGDGPAPHEGPS